MVNNTVSRLDRIYLALSDPTRRAILARLRTGPARVKDLAEPFAISGPAISKHLRLLEDAGLLSREVQGRTHWCHVLPDGLAEAESWLCAQRGAELRGDDGPKGYQPSPEFTPRILDFTCD